MVVDKGSLVLDRPLSRDFLSGTSVRFLTDADQYRAEPVDIYLDNPQSSHSNNGERENSLNLHGENGSMGNSSQQQLGRKIWKSRQCWNHCGLEASSHSGNGGVVDPDATTTPLPCGKPRPPIERVGTPIKELTLQTWLLRSHFQQNKIHWKQCHEYYTDS